MEWVERDTQVPCQFCAEGILHSQHFYRGCDCAASGFGEDHRSHCSLYGLRFINHDALIRSEAFLAEHRRRAISQGLCPLHHDPLVPSDVPGRSNCPRCEPNVYHWLEEDRARTLTVIR